MYYPTKIVNQRDIVNYIKDKIKRASLLFLKISF